MHKKIIPAEAPQGFLKINPIYVAERKNYLLVFFRKVGIWMSFSGTLLSGFFGFWMPVKAGLFAVGIVPAPVPAAVPVPR